MIDRREVIRMARLARLELSEMEIDQYQKDLTSFLTSGKKLQQVDVSRVEGTSHAVSVAHELRKDEVGKSLPQEAVLLGGPQVQDGFFRVPRIVEAQE
ncbi:MAG TPA: Asp-tRNA(Asn)/Glu-tRNA(Gln) amidotransferase subunit GatB [Firmicutes bacterium]|nr:Asp-tRNA(Asn)/Glu-tRNA(Gln) amidotransferase subunit GatB [Bacillota bacterium]